MPTALHPEVETLDRIQAYEAWGTSYVCDFRQKFLYLMARRHMVRRFPEVRCLVIPAENATDRLHLRFYTEFADAYEMNGIANHKLAHEWGDELRTKFLESFAGWKSSIVAQNVGNVLGLKDFDRRKATAQTTINGLVLIGGLLTGVQHQTGDPTSCDCCAHPPAQHRLEYSCSLDPIRWTPVSDQALVRIARLWGFAGSWIKPHEDDFEVSAWDGEKWPDDANDLRSLRRKAWEAFAGPGQSDIRGAAFAEFRKAYDVLLSADVKLRKNSAQEAGRVDVRKTENPPRKRKKNGSVEYTLASGQRDNAEGFDLTLTQEGDEVRLNVLVKGSLATERGESVALEVRGVKVVVETFDGLEHHLTIDKHLSSKAGRDGREFEMTVDQASHPYGFAIRAIPEGSWLPAGRFLWTGEEPAIIAMGADASDEARLVVRMVVNRCDVWTRGSNAVLTTDRFLQLLKGILKEPDPAIDASERHDVFRQTYRVRYGGNGNAGS